jgi:hypothetical protein
MAQNRPRGIVVIAWFMIVFGGAEVITGFTHNFFGLHTTQGMVSAYAGAAIGALYAMAGLFVLTLKKHVAVTAIALLIAVICGRSAMVGMGLYPIDSLRQAIAIVLGTSLAVGFAIYIGLRRSAFR